MAFLFPTQQKIYKLQKEVRRQEESLAVLWEGYMAIDGHYQEMYQDFNERLKRLEGHESEEDQQDSP